jgi:GxxExxY protein
VELKSVSKLNDLYRIQTLNYMKLLNLAEGFLINFPEKNTSLEFQHVEIHSQDNS